MKRVDIKKYPLSDSTLASLEPEEKEYRVKDSNNLYFTLKSAVKVSAKFSVPVVKRPNFITKQATSWLLHTKKSYCFRTAALRIWVGGTDGLKTVNRQSMRLLIFYQGLYIRSKPPSRLQCRAV